MNNKYISTDNYEIIEKNNFFEVDEKIAETISILNKKGYITKYSCSGHLLTYSYKFKDDISLINEAKKDNLIHIFNVNDKSFEYYRDVEITSVYVKFIKHYNFPNLPDGFEYETTQEQKDDYLKNGFSNIEDITFGDLISKKIYYFKNGIRKENFVVEKK